MLCVLTAGDETFRSTPRESHVGSPRNGVWGRRSFTMLPLSPSRLYQELGLGAGTWAPVLSTSLRPRP